MGLTEMSRRTEKVASTIRQVLSLGIQKKLSDPRISTFASITRVEVSGDLMHANVYVSVMGGESEERKTMQGLGAARGYLQSLLAKKLTTRHCPQIRFVTDRGIKNQLRTLELIDQISEERRMREAAEAGQDVSGSPEVPAPDRGEPAEGTGQEADERVSPGESR